MLICGVDEAGRGPVIGPMVIAAVVIDEPTEKEFERLGVTDSKLIEPEAREELFEKIKETSKEHLIISLNPPEIDKWMDSASLNDVEAIKTAELIDSLRVSPDVCYVDSPDTIPDRYGKNISTLTQKKTKIVSENKADMKYIVVGAASILAKVTRDREIEKIKRRYGDIGSGYPSDEVTQKWLNDYFKEHRSFPDIVRKKWATVSNVMQQKLTGW